MAAAGHRANRAKQGNSWVKRRFWITGLEMEQGILASKILNSTLIDSSSSANPGWQLQSGTGWFWQRSLGAERQPFRTVLQSKDWDNCTHDLILHCVILIMQTVTKRPWDEMTKSQSTLLRIVPWDFRPVSRSHNQSNPANACMTIHISKPKRNAGTFSRAKDMRPADRMTSRPRNSAQWSQEDLEILSIFSLSRCDSDDGISFYSKVPEMHVFSLVCQFPPFPSNHRSICETRVTVIQSLTDCGKSEGDRRSTMSHWDRHISDYETQYTVDLCYMEFLMKILELTKYLWNCRWFSDSQGIAGRSGDVLF
jgi:hypothetical protein